MRSPRIFIVIGTAVFALMCAGVFGVAMAQPAGNTQAGIVEATVVENDNSDAVNAEVEAYLASLEEQRQIDAYLAELHEQEMQKQAAASAAVSAPSTPANYDPGDGSRWDQLAQCECGGNWGCNTGNGFGGGLQFMHQSGYSTWLSFGGGGFAPHPWEATREQQIVVAERVLASSGWGAWPGCSRKFGWL